MIIHVVEHLWGKAFTNPNFTVENIYFLANTIVGHAE